MDEQIQNPEVHHETHDVNVRAILWFAAGFVIMAVVIHVGLYYLYKGFAARERARAEQPITLVERERRIPPEPRLQPFPEKTPEWTGAQQRALFKTAVDDMEELRAREEALLSSYGWADRKQGTVRIPIDRAMDITVQRGLPVRQPMSEEGQRSEEGGGRSE